MAATSLFVMQL